MDYLIVCSAQSVDAISIVADTLKCSGELNIVSLNEIRANSGLDIEDIDTVLASSLIVILTAWGVRVISKILIPKI